jgi:flavodoxin
MHKIKIAIRYQSRGNNTKEVALAIAKALNVNAETINVPVEDTVDLLFIGGGVYMGSLDTSFRSFMETLNPQRINAVAVFSTAGGINRTKTIAALAKERGIAVCKTALLVRMWWHNHAMLGGKGFVTLQKRQIRRINDFAETAVNESRLLIDAMPVNCEKLSQTVIIN